MATQTNQQTLKLSMQHRLRLIRRAAEAKMKRWGPKEFATFLQRLGDDPLWERLGKFVRSSNISGAETLRAVKAGTPQVKALFRLYDPMPYIIPLQIVKNLNAYLDNPKLYLQRQQSEPELDDVQDLLEINDGNEAKYVDDATYQVHSNSTEITSSNLTSTPTTVSNVSGSSNRATLQHQHQHQYQYQDQHRRQ